MEGRKKKISKGKCEVLIAPNKVNYWLGQTSPRDITLHIPLPVPRYQLITLAHGKKNVKIEYMIATL